jgi:hypothetical protein
MMQKHRIYTNLGRDQKINVEIKQDFDLMEILSLKFSQKDIYASGNCSEYGVVVGRVSANNGYGIPNAKVSIFVPLADIDVDDPVISGLYPYQNVSDKNDAGYRYNLLPSRQQHGGHAPTGTFFDQQDILTREEVLEVFESYYSYTVKTNSAGDFMIWGVPVGTQTLHIDIDLSDIGCFSLRPYDFIKKGVGVDNFERYYKFKSSIDVDGLPQIVTFDRTIDVFPFWGNEELCEIGITRTDFDLSEKGIKIEPISLILMSSVTDDNNDAVKRNERIRKNTGYKCNLQTTGGKVECVRQTGGRVLGSDGITQYPELEYFNISEVIDESGTAMVVLPMNMEYVYTNEFGEEEITNDPRKGIPTTAIARFRFSLDYNGRKTTAAKYLVPNIREFNPNTTGINNNDEYSEGMLATYQFSDVFEDYITPQYPATIALVPGNYTAPVKAYKKDLMLGTANNGVPEDYFYKFIFGKVYTVSSFQGSHFDPDRRDAFLGIKQIRPTAEEDCASKTNYFPINYGFKNRVKFSLLLAQVLLFIQLVLSTIIVKFAELLGTFFWNMATLFYGIGINRWRPFRKFSEQLKDLSYRIQDRFTQQLPLTIYPDCEECETDDNLVISDISFANTYCRVAEIKLKVDDWGGNIYLYIHDTNASSYYRTGTTDPTFLQTEFPLEFAKDSEGLCSGTTSPNYDQLVGIENLTVSIPGDPNTARYVGEVYAQLATGTSGSTLFGDFTVFFNNSSTNPEDSKFVYNPSVFGSPGKEITFTYEEFNELTGIDYYSASPPIDDANTYAIIRIYDRATLKEAPVTGSTVDIETGCNKYDTVYNEDIAYTYIWGTGTTYGLVTSPENPPTYTDAPGYIESVTQSPPYNNLLSTVIGSSNTKRLPYKQIWTRIGNAVYDRKTKSGLSELRDGVFTIIPVIKGRSYNLKALQEWYRRKRVGLSFCGGIINYTFIDNWLNGILYFFKFDKRIRWDNEGNLDLNQRGSRFPRNLIFFNILDKNFYYRCTPYIGGFSGQTYSSIKEILHPTTFYDVGVRDEFLYEICIDPRVDPTCSVIRDIETTTYQDPANVVEYAINYRLDTNAAKFDVNDFFNGITYGAPVKVFDGDITQLMSINCEAGIEAFDLDSPHYFMYNGEYMDPENPYFATYFKSGSNWGPTPIDFKFDSNGSFIRGCLNYRLGDYSQKVPFYLWDKRSTGFGPYGSTSDTQRWDKANIASMSLQRLFSISGTTDVNTNYIMDYDEEKYLLKPMTITHSTFSVTGDTEDMLERFEVISTSPPTSVLGFIDGDLWLYVTSGTTKNPLIGTLYVIVNHTWVSQPDQYVYNYRETFVPQTATNYRGNKQVLSTPFLFYFGLKPEKTALDLLIKYFGPKGAFIPSETVVCPNPELPPGASPSPTPTPTVTPTITITPTPSATPGLPPSQTPTPTPTITNTPSSEIFGYNYEVIRYGNECEYLTDANIYNPTPLSVGYYYCYGPGAIYYISAEATFHSYMVNITSPAYFTCAEALAGVCST